VVAHQDASVANHPSSPWRDRESFDGERGLVIRYVPLLAYVKDPRVVDRLFVCVESAAAQFVARVAKSDCVLAISEPSFFPLHQSPTELTPRVTHQPRSHDSLPFFDAIRFEFQFAVGTHISRNEGFSARTFTGIQGATGTVHRRLENACPSARPLPWLASDLSSRTSLNEPWTQDRRRPDVACHLRGINGQCRRRSKNFVAANRSFGVTQYLALSPSGSTRTLQRCGKEMAAVRTTLYARAERLIYAISVGCNFIEIDETTLPSVRTRFRSPELKELQQF